MAEALAIIGAIASVATLIDYTAKVIHRLKEYRSKVKELPSALIHIDEQLPLLRRILEQSKAGMENKSISLSDAEAIKPYVQGCQQQMEKLEKMLPSIIPEAQAGQVERMTKGVRSIWKDSALHDIEAAIDFYVSRFTLYCAFSSSKLNQDMLDRVAQWLAPPDPFTNLEDSLKSRLAETGRWYLEGAQYQAWKREGPSFTWLHGAAGSGKTILTAGIIKDLQDYCKDDATRSLAFFFFDFRESDKKQDPVNMVKSLLCQFLNNHGCVPEPVRRVYAACDDGRRQASGQQLLLALRHMLMLSPAPFVVIDALDECQTRSELFNILEQIHSWGIDSLRVLLTSRKEVEIEEMLEELVQDDSRISLQSHQVDEDIKTYVHKRLLTDNSFVRWQKYLDIQQEIEVALGKKAGGMFRWAACQMDTLAQCVNRGKIRRALQDLPKTLEDTYARILGTIDEGQNAEEALKILRWLAYAEQPLTVTELLEVTGIFIEEGPSRFDEDEVLVDPSDILRICSSLVSITSNERVSDESDNGSEMEYQSFDDQGYPVFGTIYIRLAHASVREYLVSDRPCIARYSLQYEESHDVLASCCLVYLLRLNEDQRRRTEWESAFPLARYAARFWTQHARASEGWSQRQRDLSMVLLTESLPAFSAWMRFYDVEFQFDGPSACIEISDLPSSLFVASRMGIVYAVYTILHDTSTDIDAEWGSRGNALQAASVTGHKKIVEILLAKGANVNAEGGRYGNALQAASAAGYEILLAKGANVNAEGGRYGNALQAASFWGYEKIVEILLAKGANVNAEGGRYGNALQAASVAGHEKMVEILLAHGAEYV